MNFDIVSRSPEGLLTLLNMRGVGQKTAIALARRYARINEIIDATDEELRQITTMGVISTLRDPSALFQSHGTMQRILDDVKKHAVRVISCFDDEYPILLRKIPDLPAVIYAKGVLRNDPRYVACVGTREPSEFGTKVAQRMTRMLSDAGWGIVSGLAAGVDGLCHRATLDAKGYTVAILANGLDTVYPAAHKKLAAEILDKGGALISEQPIGTRAMGQFLVKRDRLQSGMSLATFVMQTDIVGGTMHTVRFTIEQKRLLFVPVPPKKFADEDKSQGIKALGELKGPCFADRVQADTKYRELLTERFSQTTPAIPILNRDHYGNVRERLSSELQKYCSSQTQRSVMEGSLKNESGPENGCFPF